ncbi:MAG: peptidylprolyl isomerase [Verrucomicrobiota bacterium]|nr:peptidylprolyl isomerase [Verrucomicrobiota bacterium]
MKENKTTIVFLAAAAVCIALAIFTSPVKRDPSSKVNRMGQPLFETFDPREATGIEIVEMDEEELEAKSIEVAQTNKGWLIRRPGKPDYPANADNQVKDVSTILFDVRILDQAGEGAGEHAKFGVLDPTRAQPGESGVGRMIALKNNSGSNLAQLIIGNEVDGLVNTHFVRKPDENEVYRVEMQNVNDVSTKFVDWVEKDFLDLDKWNIKQVTFDNYEVKDGKMVASEKQILDYADSEWNLIGSLLSENEELNKEKLDNMKDAFDDLEIIDVEKKPAVLASSLREGNEFVAANNVQELKNSAKSLFDKGFLTVEMAGKDGKPMKYEDGKPKLQVVSKKGEIVVGMKDGVEYVLRFGEAYRGPEEDENATGDSRYIYAYARVNPNLLDQPELEPVPAPFVAPKKKSDDSSKPSKEKKGVKGPEGEKGKQSPPPLNPPGPPPNFTPPSPPPGKPPVSLPKEVQSSTASSEKDSNSSSADQELTKKKADREAEIARVKSSNAQKQKEFNDKVAEAQKRVRELNENLADWYYVISNEVYEKIRLDRQDFVKAKETESEDLPEEISASHILISYKGASRADAKITRSKEEAKTEAERIHKLVTSEGNDFAETAKKHSDGPSSTKGGDLGKFKFEVMAKPFSEAAFSLDVGSVSEVVETDFGFHVIKRTG